MEWLTFNSFARPLPYPPAHFWYHERRNADAAFLPCPLATFLSPADLDLRSGQLLQPDLFVVDPRDAERPTEWSEIGIPLLVAEVLSASTARFDRITKRYRFQRSGVPTYWIVDLDARLVEVWTPDADRPVIAAEQLTWRPVPDAEPLVIDLGGYFGEVLGA